MIDEEPLQAGKTRIVSDELLERSLRLHRARLVVERGPDAGREVSIEQGSVTVGTSTENDLVLKDDAVSGRHFEIVATPEGHLLRDLASTNGTWLAGCKVGKAVLVRAARLVVGESELRFELLGDDIEVALSDRTRFGPLLGHSPSMRAVFSILERTAMSNSTILILGESGTGKELAARGVHEASGRKGPFVVFDCGAASSTLLEEQLFGHARGAFTGAVVAREGVLESADGGTLVLDEIGELPLEVQPKLLRALETRTLSRLGETKTREVDVRFVASTNRNLEEEVRAGRFRRDLFFRLSVIAVRLPPLRERKEELPLLVNHFLSQLSSGNADAPEALVDALRGHDWPGNVRELRNFVERYLSLPDLTPSALLDVGLERVEETGPSIATNLPFHEAKQRWLEHFEREYVEQLLERNQGNISAFAREASLSRQSCYALLKRLGLDGKASPNRAR